MCLAQCCRPPLSPLVSLHLPHTQRHLLIPSLPMATQTQEQLPKGNSVTWHIWVLWVTQCEIIIWYPHTLNFLKPFLDLIQELSHQLTPQPQMQKQKGGISPWNVNERRDGIETERRKVLYVYSVATVSLPTHVPDQSLGQALTSLQRDVTVSRNRVWDGRVWKEKGWEEVTGRTLRAAWGNKGRNEKSREARLVNTRLLFAEKESRKVSFQAFQDLESYYKSRFAFKDI